MSTALTVTRSGDTAAMDLALLRAHSTGSFLLPGDDGWDAARRAFQLTVDQRPAAIALPADEHDVSLAVRYAAGYGLRVAPQRTGHNAAPLGSLDDTVLLRTDRMQSVAIDAVRRTVRVGGGAKWEHVLDQASAMGLAALHGSTPDVSVAGYALGGGMGWYARKHGLAANSVTAVELVTADGRLRRVDADDEPELFWALRGGNAGNFGVVTALELQLFPVAEVYAGVLFFPWERSAEVLHAWHEWVPGVPDEITSVGRILRFPLLDVIPEPLRGGSFAVVEAVHLGTEAEGAELLRPLRALGPEIDTFAMVPPAGIAELHMDPTEPVPALGDHQLLGELPPSAIDDLVAVAGPGSGSPLISMELRHTGGALARSAPGHGALSTLPGSFATFGVGLTGDEQSTAAVAAQLARIASVLRPYEVDRRYGNFVEQQVDTSGLFPPDAYRRLQAVRAAVDPGELFRANHPIPPAR